MNVDDTYLANVSEEGLRSNVVIRCTTSDGYPCLLIKNSKEKTGYSPTSLTDNLKIKFDTLVTENGSNYYCHLIQSRKNDYYSTQQFNIVFEYVFNKITAPIDSTSLYSLVTSLEEYFRITPEQNKTRFQIGVFGELLFVRCLYQAGYPEITEKYHKNFYSKHDIEISSSLRMEIKTAEGEHRIHHFKHNQIHRSDVDVLVGSVLLERASSGLSLRDLFTQVIALYKDPDAVFALRKLMARCGISDEDAGPSFSEEKALSDIRIYNAAKLPQLPIDDVDGVTGVEYDVDCSLAESIELSEVLQILHK
jgi:hypothetical protein